MSKPWNHRTFQTRGRVRRGRARLTWSEARMVLLGGCFIGLTYGWGREDLPSEPPSFEESVAQPEEVHTADPWAESRRSSAILRAQEGAPAGSSPSGGPVGRRVKPTQGSVRIVDGDTFWYGGEKIRIADIDTPEVRGRCAYESQLAARATDRMSELLEAGSFELQPISGRDEDRHGRKLRVVTRGGRSLGDQLVAEGLARTWTGRREPWCA